MKTIITIAAITAMAGTAAAQPTVFLDLGVIGGEGNYTFDTNGSFMTSSGFDMDTELGLWDNAGMLLGNDDDGGDGLWSLINIDLTAGMYWLGGSEFNSDFADGWAMTGSQFEPGEFGEINMNINTVFAGSQTAGNLDTGYEPVVWFKVTVVPAPASLALLGLGGLVATRRRR